MKSNLPVSDQVAIVATAAPRNGTTAFQSGWAPLSKAHQYLAVIQAGVIAATGTVNAKLEQATDASGTGAKDIEGKAITQLGPDDSGKIAEINVRPGELDAENGYAFVRLSITPAVANAAVGGVILATNPRFGPASKLNAEAVAEIVN